MDAVYVQRFVTALRAKNDAAALSMLADGQVTIHTLFTDTNSNRMPLIVAAVYTERRKVVEAFARHGANINQLIRADNGFRKATVLGWAILNGHASMLPVLHRLGATMSQVYVFMSLGTSKLEQSFSAVETAIHIIEPGCLLYLLDAANPRIVPRPIILTKLSMMDLCHASSTGRRAIPIFKALKTCDFDFGTLKQALPVEFRGPSVAGGSAHRRAPNPVSYADFLLMCAVESGDVSLMRYLVKQLGMVSPVGNMEATKDYEDLRKSLQFFDNFHGPRPGAPLAKYKCASCESVCATKWCPACKVTRYCSVECQRVHWKSGGHKKGCKELQRLAEQNSSAAAGPSEL